MKTVLYDEHIEQGAKIVDFAGWQMPIQYESILAEHFAVRNSAGLFDVSHMGIIHIKGQDAEKFLNFISANKILDKHDNSATYTVLCNEQGGSVDDTLIYKFNNTHYFIVANASNRAKDLNHLKTYAANYKITIEDHYESHGILALQGPTSGEILKQLLPDVHLKPMHLQSTFFEKTSLIVSRTGYTGELGFELFAPNDLISRLWNRMLILGAIPCGLGARDTLRLEKGFALYGHELSEEISPLESVASWVVKMEDHEFLGKRALEKQVSSGHRHAHGIILQEKAIPRENFSVLKDGKLIGKTTSGNFSPSLALPIALFLSTEPVILHDELEVIIREKAYKAKVSSLPFY